MGCRVIRTALITVSSHHGQTGIDWEKWEVEGQNKGVEGGGDAQKEWTRDCHCLHACLLHD